MKRPENEAIYREIRKLIDILSTWGNVLVNGNISAQSRLSRLCTQLHKQGMSLDDIDAEIKSLEIKNKEK